MHFARWFRASKVLNRTYVLSGPFRREFLYGMVCLSQCPSLLTCSANPVGRYVTTAFIFDFDCIESI